MAWSAPKTWVDTNILTASEMNEQVRDNLLYLYSGIQRVIGQWIRKQTAAISGLTRLTWVDINGGGLTGVEVGAVSGDDILEITVGGRVEDSANVTDWTIGVQIYEGVTLIQRYTGPSVADGNSLNMTVVHQFPSGYSDIHVYMCTYVNSDFGYNGVLEFATDPEVYGFMSVLHKRPPAA